MNNQAFPAGKFTYTVGEHSPVVDIYEGGKMTLSLEGEIIVISKYQVMGDILEVEDVEGSYAIPEYGVGKYQWKADGDLLTFILMDDKAPSRQKAFAVPWRRVE
jgi:hypothetical protein